MKKALTATEITLKKKILFTLLLSFIGATAYYARFIEPDYLQVRRVAIADNILWQHWGGLTIAQISDLHVEKFGRREEALLRELTSLQPDLIAVTGDSAQWFLRPDPALQLLEKLKARLGVYVVLGDADFSSNRYHCQFCHSEQYSRSAPHGFRVLRDQIIHLPLPEPGENGRPRQLLLAGLDPQPEKGRPGTGLPAELSSGGADQAPLLILGHFSKKWAEVTHRSQRPLLWLAGDTHGGQILLPAFVWQWLRIKPDAEHMAGLFPGPHAGQWLYVNRGIGTTAGLPFRCGVRPEITIFTFSPESGEK